MYLLKFIAGRHTNILRERLFKQLPYLSISHHYRLIKSLSRFESGIKRATINQDVRDIISIVCILHLHNADKCRWHFVYIFNDIRFLVFWCLEVTNGSWHSESNLKASVFRSSVSLCICASSNFYFA